MLLSQECDPTGNLGFVTYKTQVFKKQNYITILLLLDTFVLHLF